VSMATMRSRSLLAPAFASVAIAPAANLNNILHHAAFEIRPSGHLEELAPVAIGCLAVAFRNVQGVNIQLLMPESHGCPFDSDSGLESQAWIPKLESHGKASIIGTPSGAGPQPKSTTCVR
jgi:hypothetical protein